MKNEGPCNRPVCQKPCPKIADWPVCASNGKTYKSMCRFKMAQCKAKLNGVTITVENIGPCNSKRPVCQKPCPRIADWPVCASNGKTYKSMCRFKMAQCKAKLNGV